MYLYFVKFTTIELALELTTLDACRIPFSTRAVCFYRLHVRKVNLSFVSLFTSYRYQLFHILNMKITTQPTPDSLFLAFE